MSREEAIKEERWLNAKHEIGSGLSNIKGLMRSGNPVGAYIALEEFEEHEICSLIKQAKPDHVK